MYCVGLHEILIPTDAIVSVMNIKWDYGYYQLWSDNEWLVDKIIALMDEDVTM